MAIFSHRFRFASSILLIFFLTTVIFATSSKAVQPACGISLGEWQKGPDAPAVHIEGATAVVDEKLFIIAGFKDNSLKPGTRVDVYNPVSNMWETEANPRRPAPLNSSHIQAAVDGTSIWTAGGFKGEHPGLPTDEVWRYDSVEDLWYAGPSLPEPRSAGFFQRIGRTLHYGGGTSYDRDTAYPDHWTLNLDNLSEGWQKAPDFPQARIHTSAVRIDGLMYVIGGQFNHDHDPVDLKFLHVFNPGTGSWTQKADLPVARSHHEPGTVLIEDHIVLVGGRQNQAGLGQTDDVTEYDPVTNTWRELRPLPVPLIAPAAAYLDGKLIVTNGGYGWNIGSKETFISQVTIIPCDVTPSPTLTTVPTEAPTEIPAGTLAVIAPAKNEIVHTSNYVFKWTQVQGITEYRLDLKAQDKSYEFRQTFDSSVCKDGICATSLDLANHPLPNNTTLKVRIVANNSNGRPKGNWVTFRTEMPGKAALIQPADGGLLNIINPQFVWEALPAVERYKVVIKLQDTGKKVFKQTYDFESSPSIDEICDNTACIVNTSGLSLGVNYRWHVVTSNADGKSKSAKAVFTVTQVADTPAPSNLLPLP
jgi:N-acetylneuraminic acid mutarotase